LSDLPAFAFAAAAEAASIAITTAAAAAATTAAAAAAAKATSAATTATTGPIAARASLADVKGATVHFLAIQAGDSCLSLSIVGHLNKAKTAGITREVVLDDADFGYRTKGFELLAKLVLADPTRQIADVDVHRNLLVLFIFPRFLLKRREKKING
jgi:hypothetical protein